MTQDEKPARIPALAVGALFCILVGIAVPYITNIIVGSAMFLDFDTPGAMLLLLLLVLLWNGMLARCARVLALGRSSLALIHVMVITASAIVSLGFVENLIPTLAGVRYYATTSPEWQDNVLPYLPSWIAPINEGAVTAFFDGLKPGESIPWLAWTLPLACWGVLIVAMGSVMIAVMSILRKQWVEHERLVFPLAQLPLMMIETGSGTARPFLRRGTVWAGFAVAFVVLGVNCLSHYFPGTVPRVPLRFYTYLDGDRPFLNVVIVFPIIAFTYLIDTQVSFSMWFFCLIGIAQRHLGERYGLGVGANDPFSSVSALMSHLGTGAAIVFVARFLWVGRDHIVGTLRRALGYAHGADDSEETLSHRAAWILLVLGVGALIVWLSCAGMSVLTASVCLFGAFTCFLALTRAVAQTGIAASGSPIIPSAFAIRTLGSGLLSKPDLIALGFTWPWGSDMRTFVMASAANGVRIVSDMPVRGRRIFFVGMIVALVVTFIATSATILWLAYHRGGSNLDPWFFRWVPTMPFNYALSHMRKPSGPEPARYIATLAGMGFMAFLLFMQSVLHWWPFHPVGYLVGTTYIVTWFWFSIFLAWFVKVSVQRYGGRQSYEKTRDFLLGLALGQFAAGGFWILVDFMTGHTGNLIPMV
jgi:hypothetical protein